MYLLLRHLQGVHLHTVGKDHIGISLGFQEERVMNPSQSAKHQKGCYRYTNNPFEHRVRIAAKQLAAKSAAGIIGHPITKGRLFGGLDFDHEKIAPLVGCLDIQDRVLFRYKGLRVERVAHFDRLCRCLAIAFQDRIE